MSYSDGNSGHRNKALTGGVVVLLQAGLAIALVNGFAVALFPTDPPRHLASEFFPTTPVSTDPVEPPRADPSQQPARDPVITAVQPRLAIVPDDTFAKPILDPVLPAGAVLGTGDEFVIAPPVLPTTAPARFPARSAKPRGDVARWVTTEDYPTADIRAGHTGTVRFRLAIDASGRVTGCTVTQSSGYPGLDAATCRNVTRRARFDAASDTVGDKVTGDYNGTIRWVIPQD